MKICNSIFAVVSALSLPARTVSVPPLPASPYLDTEASTNVPFGANYDVTREIVVNFALDGGCSSNCILR